MCAGMTEVCKTAACADMVTVLLCSSPNTKGVRGSWTSAKGPFSAMFASVVAASEATSHLPDFKQFKTTEAPVAKLFQGLIEPILCH